MLRLHEPHTRSTAAAVNRARRPPASARRGLRTAACASPRNAANALLGVRDHGRRRHQLDGEGVGAVLVEVDLGVEALLAQTLRLDAAAGAGDEVPRRLVELVRGHDLVDQAPVGRGRGVDGVAGEGHLQRPLATDVAGHRDERRVAEQPPLPPGMAKAGVLRGDGEVARGHELAARRGGQRWTLATTGWGSPGRRPSSRCRSGTGAGRRPASAPAHVAEVVAGREHGPFAARITPSAPLSPTSRNAAVSSTITSSQGVALLRPVERDRRDRPVLLDEQVLIRHAAIVAPGPRCHLSRGREATVQRPHPAICAHEVRGRSDPHGRRR